MVDYPSPYRPKGKDIYYFMYQNPQTGKRSKRSTGCRTKRGAQEYVREFIDGLIKNETPTLRAYTRDYFKSIAECPWYRVQTTVVGNTVSARQLQNKRGHLVNYWWRWFGDVPVDQITAPMIRSKLSNTDVKQATKKQILYTGSSVFADIAFEGLISGDPCKLVKIYINDAVSTDIFTPEELSAFFAVDMPLQYRALFSLLRGSGIRLSEALALQWRDVLLEQRGVLILKSTKDRSEQMRRTKTETSRRVAAFNVHAARELQRWYMASSHVEDESYVFPGRWMRDRAATYMDRRSANAQFNLVCTQADIDREGRALTIRSFRTTFNTVIHDEVGASLRKAQLGHATDRMSDETYYRGEGYQQVVKRLEALHQYDHVFDAI